MQDSLNVARLLRSMPAVFALAACANASYQYDPADLELTDGGRPGVAGSFAAGGSSAVAGSVGVAGTSSGLAGTSAGGSSAGGSTSHGGSTAQGGSTAAGSTSMGGTGQAGSGQAGSVGNGGSTSGKCTAKPWSADTVYMTGDKATKGGKEYTAAYYTQTDPETHCCGNGAEWASSVSCQ